MYPAVTCRRLLAVAWISAGLVAVLSAQAQQPALDAVRKAEAERVAVVEKVKPAVVAIFMPGGQGGGSGVLISKDGYAITNWHVVDKIPPAGIQCGLPDGNYYDAVLVGLDKVGDVALIKLLPKKDGQEFPAAPLGNSDTVQEGDWTFAMGNPFLLATDFTPTVTFGMVSGVHRYQYPAGTLLEYTDCIQIDTSVNPGNSGGPLFNLKGELVGINGRISADKRGRLNSGVGYAISINQIKNFLGHLRAGIETDHASLGAQYKTEADSSGLSKVVVTSILEDCDAARRGLDLDDEILTFDGRRITSANQLQNVLGLFPRGWRLPMEFRREAPREGKEDDVRGRKEILVRLMGAVRREIGGPGGAPKVRPGPAPSGPSPAAKFYVPKPGFTNYYFNKLERDKLLAAFRKHGDFSGVGGTWKLSAKFRRLRSNSPSKTTVEVTTVTAKNGSVAPVVRLKSEDAKGPETFEPLDPQDLKRAASREGMMAAFYLYHRLLTQGAGGFAVKCDHGGHEPVYPPRADETKPASLRELREEADVLNTRLGIFQGKWFFNRKDQRLRALEVRIEDNEDPCEVYFSDYRAVNGRELPHVMEVYLSGTRYAIFEFTAFDLSAK
jgi:S1-C subfamily serine protease